jgi:predicted nicotinamide N-methyase
MRDSTSTFVSGGEQSPPPRLEPLPAELVEETVEIGGRRFSLLRPRNPEALLDEAAFEHEEFLPYWAELWPSAVALARAVSARGLRGLRALELGCGLALPSVVAALGGAEVLATDWSPDALRAAALNAERNGARVATQLVSWADPGPLLTGAPWDVVLGSDLLYERRNVEQLLELLPRLVDSGGEVLLADPGRPLEPEFLERAAASWQIASEPAGLQRVRLHRLRIAE